MLLDKSKPLHVLDLGANGGGFSLLLNLMGYTVNKLVAEEMNQLTFARLSFNILRNLNGKIQFVQVAVASTNGVMTLVDSDGGISDSFT